MSFEVLTPAGDPFNDAAAPPWAAGTETDVLEARVWWSRTDSSPSPAADVIVMLEIEDPGEPGTWLSAGLAPLDERWARVRVVDEVTTAHPEMGAQRTDWTPLGGGAVLRLDPISAGCARALEVKWIIPGFAQPAPYRVRLTPIGNARAIALPAGVTDVDRGILTGVGDLSWSGLVRGGEVTPSGTPDDELHVAALQYLHRGRLLGLPQTTATLDDEDVDGDPLAAGEAYMALLSLDAAGLLVTKGTKAISPVRPALAAGDVFLRWAVVRYTGGAPEIAGTDLEGETLYDRFMAIAGPGRAVAIHPGRAIGGGTLRHRGDRETIALPASATRWIWQLATGAYDLTTVDVAPESTAIALWQVTTNATDVTALVDRRLYAGGASVFNLGGEAPGSPGEVASQLAWEGRLWIERVLWRVDTHGAATAGASTLAVLVDGVSIFSGAGSRVPAIAWDADPLYDNGALPEACEIRAGQIVSVETATYPTGGAPGWVECLLVCRRG
ncbi:MAG TPA: hypothetical protein VGS22_16460 [Thermoanaerobaculia bacterium]|jgi:hypothetical protein|nr:hypothetical protein [Thermoanaerobaculia bacterium]